MSRNSTLRIAMLALFAGVFLAAGAQAAIVAQGSQNFSDDLGFFSGVKAFTVYTSDDAGNPNPGPAGSYTYVYTITNDPGSFVSLIGFNLEVAPSSVGAVAGTDFGYVDDLNPATPTPTAFVLEVGTGSGGFDVVRYDWAAPGIAPGATSDELFIISFYSPGTVNDNVYSIEGDFASDETSSCIGPFTPPETEGEPMPCTIGFWKNRVDGKKGTLQWFPNGDLDTVVATALALSGGVFTSADLNGSCNPPDFDDLICALTSKGSRSIGERARQQLAATLLNLAAGDEFPDNQKCKLFEGNQIGSNGCGDAISVGEAVGQALVDVLGTTDDQHHAHDCSDDLNNGVSVTQQ